VHRAFPPAEWRERLLLKFVLESLPGPAAFQGQLNWNKYTKEKRNIPLDLPHFKVSLIGINILKKNAIFHWTCRISRLA
jgi:hypothetical protein